MYNQAFIKGFVKRAAEYGVPYEKAIRLSKTAFDLQPLKGDLISGLAGAGLATAAGAGLGAINSAQEKISPEELADLRTKLKVPNSVTTDLATQKENFWNVPKMNAYFEPVENVVRTFSSNMNTKPILAHELGHASIHHEGGPMGFLQDHVYPHTSALGGVAQGAMNKVMNKETDLTRGAMYGAGAQLAAHAGKILPELEASRRGVSALNEGKPLKEQIKNYAAVAPGAASYFAPVAGGAIQGAMKAHANKLKGLNVPADTQPDNTATK